MFKSHRYIKKYLHNKHKPRIYKITKILNSEENQKEKSPIKWQNKNLKHIKRMDNNCQILTPKRSKPGVLAGYESSALHALPPHKYTLTSACHFPIRRQLWYVEI